MCADAMSQLRENCDCEVCLQKRQRMDARYAQQGLGHIGDAVTLPERVTGEPEACAGKSGQEAPARLFAPALHGQGARL